MVKTKPSFKRLAAFLGLNFCLSLFICSAFLFFSGGQPLELVYLSAALFSNTAMLYAALALPAVLLFIFTPGRAILYAVMAVFQLTLFTDAAVYKIFKFHMNSMVLNLLITPGGIDSLELGWGMKAFFVFVAVFMGLAQWLFWRWSAALPEKFSVRKVKVLAAFLLFCVVADKGMFAWGTLYDSVYITRNIQLFPLYQPLRLRSFASKHFGFKLDKEVTGGIDVKYSMLTYPRVPLQVQPPAKQLNYVILVIDSLRRDMFNGDSMPETWAFSKKAAVFRNHYSGGNCTRFGIFSIFYGIYGSYWFGMVGERRAPVFMDTLMAQGYDMRFFASSELSFPEFNKSCFVNIPRSGIYDKPKAEGTADRDREISDKLIEYIRGRKQGKPYFAFLFYDASHGAYVYPPEFEKFKPAMDTNRLALNQDNIKPLFNKYKNSVYYDDHLVGGILKALTETGGLKDTVVIITGDHGEAFLERGRYGHNQSFTPEEVRVPLVLYLPGRAPYSTDAVTSHLDIVPTLLPMIGVKNPVTDYSSGRGLFEKTPRPFIASFSWDTAAIIRNGETLIVPMQAYKGGAKAYDSEFRPEDNTAAASFEPLIVNFQKEVGKFSK